MTTCEEKIAEIREAMNAAFDKAMADAKALDVTADEIVWQDNGHGPFFVKDGWKVCIFAGESPHYAGGGRAVVGLGFMNKRFMADTWSDPCPVDVVKKKAEAWFRDGCKTEG